MVSILGSDSQFRMGCFAFNSSSNENLRVSVSLSLSSESSESSTFYIVHILNVTIVENAPTIITAI
jgi:hypothetical protein